MQELCVSHIPLKNIENPFDLVTRLGTEKGEYSLVQQFACHEKVGSSSSYPDDLILLSRCTGLALVLISIFIAFLLGPSKFL